MKSIHLFRSVSIILAMSGLLIGQNLDWENYDPPSTLVVPETPIVRAKYPFIDAHSHQWRMGPSDLADGVVEMDAMNMGIMVNLSGRGGSQLKAMASNVAKSYPNRFAIFTNLNFNGVDNGSWAKSTVARLEEDFKNGAKGLK
ncbi:MAG: amidohydrolase, partial [Verrucomicrobiota bacterium]|nr:amidohydrolase [Verrucomicrobiota bacterium]